MPSMDTPTACSLPPPPARSPPTPPPSPTTSPYSPAPQSTSVGQLVPWSRLPRSPHYFYFYCSGSIAEASNSTWLLLPRKLGSWQLQPPDKGSLAGLPADASPGFWEVRSRAQAGPLPRGAGSLQALEGPGRATLAHLLSLFGDTVELLDLP